MRIPTVRTNIRWIVTKYMAASNCCKSLKHLYLLKVHRMGIVNVCAYAKARVFKKQPISSGPKTIINLAKMTFKSVRNPLKFDGKQSFYCCAYLTMP